MQANSNACRMIIVFSNYFHNIIYYIFHIFSVKTMQNMKQVFIQLFNCLLSTVWNIQSS
jgi:hypothetical protein